jgi:uncharacterized protein (DUF2147 family)
MKHQGLRFNTHTQRALYLALTSWLLLVSPPLRAQADISPVGLWQSIDDATGKPRAQIRINQTGDVLTGRIAASSTPTSPGTVQRCERCTDDRANQALIGMELIRNLRPSGSALVWAGGEILDPDTGTRYRLQITLQAAGKQLQVRGYIGPFFRNQIWLRLE